MTVQILSTQDFIDISNKYDSIWIGEVHGITENYKAYEKIISLLIMQGFNSIIWEMPSGFNKSSDNTDDGRISQHSISFLSWLESKKQEGKIKNITFFGDMNKNEGAFKNNEERMAMQIVDVIKNNKNIIITGNFHMGGPLNTKIKVDPCLYFVKKNTKLKILKIAITYAEGMLYNYGLKKLSTNFYFGDPENLPFGTITKRTEEDVVFFHVGEAHPVFENPSII